MNSLSLMSWSRRFDEPIALPDGRKLVTLRNAGNYITKLPKAEHDAPEWQAAMEALLLSSPSARRTNRSTIWCGKIRSLSPISRTARADLTH